MWFVIPISYIVITYIDTKAFKNLKEKGILPVYIILMLISLSLSIADVYVDNLPSPSRPIRDFVISIIGG
jgi:hypothetical protein